MNKTSLIALSCLAVAAVGFTGSQDRRQAESAATQPGGASDKMSDDLKAIQGTWKTAELMMTGEKVAGDQVSAHMTISGNNYELKDSANDNTVMETGTFKLDESKSPKQMDWTIGSGEDKGTTYQAIYEIKGDTVRYCFNPDGGARPTEFSSTAENGNILSTQTRVKEDAGEDMEENDDDMDDMDDGDGMDDMN